MLTFRLVGVAAILSAAIATPVTAQQVISEPGYCAFFYPNANCQNKGPGNPYTDGNYQRRAIQNRGMPPADGAADVAGKRPQKHRMVSSAARMQ